MHFPGSRAFRAEPFAVRVWWGVASDPFRPTGARCFRRGLGCGAIQLFDAMDGCSPPSNSQRGVDRPWSSDELGGSGLVSGQRLDRNSCLLSSPSHQSEDGTWLLPIYRSLEQGGSFGHDHSEVLQLDAEGAPMGCPISVPGSTGRVHGSIVPSVDGTTL